MKPIRAFASTLLCLGAAFGLSIQSAQEPPFEKDILRFEAEDAKHPPTKGGIVFVGSSSIVRWKTLATDFPGYNVINRGFGGSELSDSARYAHRIVTPYQPSFVVLFAGTNDIAAGKSAETVFADYRAFVNKVREKLPKVPIAYISITPAPSRWDKLKTIEKANNWIHEFTKMEKNLIFVDMFPNFIDAKGGPRPELFVEDHLHMNEKGYAIWVNAIGKILPKLK